jgi:acyl-CoA hydrolase
MAKKKKFVKNSYVTMTELVLPNDTNTLNKLMGGRLMHWMDIAAAIAAQKHSNQIVVTASVDNISFNKPHDLGNVITISAQVSRAFSSSMEIYLKVYREDIPENSREQTHSAFFTFVAIDKSGKPIDVPEAVPETDSEKELYKGALRRRQLRLVLAKRMKPGDATELKSLFVLDN